jgi:DNA-binding MarR family transcriptional regulator
MSSLYTDISEIIEIFCSGEEPVARGSDLQNVAEQLALALTDLGLQRMTARVLATLLFTESPAMTMAELGDQLQASSGAISGALKMLTSVGLAERVPVPGSRRDHYRLRDDAWAVLFTGQNVTISAMQAAADTGIAATPPDSLARQRLTQMRDFYAFLLAEIPALLERWRRQSG